MALKAVTVLDYAALVLFLVLLIALFFTHQNRRQRELPLPPGPLRLPILGNIFDLPSLSAWRKYRDMSRKYGGIISLEIPGHHIVVINSLKIARDLLDKRGQTWSNRASFPVVDLMELPEWNLVVEPHHEAHRAQRRIADSALRPNALAQSNYRSIQRSRVNELLKAFLNDPQHFIEHIDFMLAGVIMEYVYGYDVRSPEDKFLYLSRVIIGASIRAFAPTASIVNFFPSLKFLPAWLPGMGEARNIEYIKRLGREVRDEPFARVIQEIKNGTAKPSLARDYILSHATSGNPDSLSGREREDIVSISAFLYAAAEDTTGTLLQSFVLLFLLRTDVQKRAQTEIDSIIGRGRIPGHADLEALPYLQAVCLEMLRWKPVTPLGVPHTATVDDVYNGYFIPKGSMVIANAWAMLHDPAKYPDPESFKPERFLDEDGKFKNDPDVMIGFGFGRRICPGRFLAVELANTTVLSMLSVFNIAKAKDDSGNEISVAGEYVLDSPIISAPLPFHCDIAPRDEQARYLILEATRTASDS